MPHSGPFARGIHATIFAQRTAADVTRTQVNEALAEFYRELDFVHVATTPPRMKDVAASNYARLHADVEGDTVVVCWVLDNLIKGAAGGGMQWVNRLLGLARDARPDRSGGGWL